MLQYALDHNDIKTGIDETRSNEEYYCPYCGTPLILKKGDIRQHHFAHRADHPCSDAWEKEGSYNTSEWHNEWQKNFPKANQEVKVALGDIKHRADVMIKRTVVEFQQSNMREKTFNDRSEFYNNLAYKLVWLFDFCF